MGPPLARPRCRRRSPVPQGTLSSSALGSCSQGRQRHSHLGRPLPGCRSLHLYKKWVPRGLRFHGPPARWPICQRQSKDSSPDGQTQNAPSLHTGWTSQQIILRSIASWKFATTSSQLPRQQPGSKFSNAAFPFGKNYNSSSRITRASRVRHSQTVCISLQRPTFGTIPLQRTPDPVKSEHLFGSSPSPSGSVWN